MKKVILFIVILLGLVILGIAVIMSFGLGSCSFVGGDKGRELDDSTKLAIEMEKRLKAQPEFEVITSHGTMKIRLYEKTPQHRDNFVKLVSEKYYDGVRFHRVIEGFMIQGGDPNSKDLSLINSWGMGGPNYTVPAEFVPEYRHKKGAIAAARKGDMANPRKASSGSQFYIVQDEMGCSHLDGQYTVFGEVFEGLDVVDRIAGVPIDYANRPYEDVIIISIRPVGFPAADVALEAESVVADTTAGAAEDTKTDVATDTAAREKVNVNPNKKAWI